MLDNSIKLLREVIAMTDKMKNSRFWAIWLVFMMFAIAALLHGLGAIKWW